VNLIRKEEDRLSFRSVLFLNSIRPVNRNKIQNLERDKDSESEFRKETWPMKKSEEVLKNWTFSRGKLEAEGKNTEFLTCMPNSA
jgi:hypothetical protein